MSLVLIWLYTSNGLVTDALGNGASSEVLFVPAIMSCALCEKAHALAVQGEIRVLEKSVKISLPSCYQCNRADNLLRLFKRFFGKVPGSQKLEFYVRICLR